MRARARTLAHTVRWPSAGRAVGEGQPPAVVLVKLVSACAGIQSAPSPAPYQKLDING